MSQLSTGKHVESSPYQPNFTPMAANFLNADLEIFSDQDLQMLIDEIGDSASLLYGGPFSDDLPYFASYEIDDDPETKTPESLIFAFCSLIESLSPAGRALWDSSRERVIDLGYRASSSREVIQDRLPAEILMKISKLQIDLAWTFYPVDEND